MSWKNAVWKLLGKDPEAVVVSFLSGPEPLARAMLDEVRSLVPDREHFAVTDLPLDSVRCIRPEEAGRVLRRKRIGLAPTLFTPDFGFVSLRRLAFRYAPGKVLAYNARLERHHLRLATPIASALFLRGVPLDRIWLRPRWLFPFRRDRSTAPAQHSVFEGRPLREGMPRIAVLTPYFPYPLSHGGAVRIFNLLREGARDFDIFLFSFVETDSDVPGTPVLEFCSKIVAFPNPRYREPRWASVDPPEAREFDSSYVSEVIENFRRQYALRVMQVEYTQMAPYRGEILVEHDVTFDLHEQVVQAKPTVVSRWDLARWRRFEAKQVRSYPRVVVMSEKDRELLGGAANLRVIPNGVDVTRFQVAPERLGRQILFVGSFRHFPNVVAFRWFVERVWPLLKNTHFVTIAGPNPEQYLHPLPNEPNLEIHAFVSDVRPFYEAANLVIVPTQVSAGTNLKALEALACQRTMISTTSGCAGLGLTHGENVWVSDDPQSFASAVETLLENDSVRLDMAAAGRAYVERHFDWRQIGTLQRRLWDELLTGIAVRQGTPEDVPELGRIQAASHTGAHWEPATYFEFDVAVAEREGRMVGFLVSRAVAREVEVLNLATAPEARRQGVATALLRSVNSYHDIFLEVRESNQVARNLYEKLGFIVIGKREEYYDDPVETALVMRLSRIASS